MLVVFGSHLPKFFPLNVHSINSAAILVQLRRFNFLLINWIIALKVL
jgi:hypothetical protein